MRAFCDAWINGEFQKLTSSLLPLNIYFVLHYGAKASNNSKCVATIANVPPSHRVSPWRECRTLIFDTSYGSKKISKDESTQNISHNLLDYGSKDGEKMESFKQIC